MSTIYGDGFVADRMPSVTLGAQDAAFLAARLRRLFKHLGVAVPGADDDARLTSNSGAAIGLLLTRWETEGPQWHAVTSEDAPGINKAIRRADVADEYADECRRDGYTRVEVVPLYAHASGVQASDDKTKASPTPAAVPIEQMTPASGITFTPGEIAALQKNPDVLRALATQNDVWESEAASMDPDLFALQIRHHRARWRQLKAEAERIEQEDQQ